MYFCSRIIQKTIVYEKEYYDFSDYNDCEGYVSIYTCLCGKEEQLNFYCPCD